MRERVRQIFKNLPPEGVAIHGTNLARAKLIAENGFDTAQMLRRDLEGKIFYIVQPPSIQMAPRTLLTTARGKSSVNIAVNLAVSHSHKAVNQPVYRFGQNGPDNETQALVVFRPVRVFDNLDSPENWHNTTEVTYESDPIPKERIYGIVRVKKSSQKMDSEIMRDILKLLSEKGIIDVTVKDSAKPRQHRQVRA